MGYYQMTMYLYQLAIYLAHCDLVGVQLGSCSDLSWDLS